MDYVVGSVAALITGNVTPNRPKLIRRALTPTKHQLSPNVTPKSEIEDRSIFLSPTLQKKKAIIKKSPKRIFQNSDLDTTEDCEGNSSLTSPKAEKVKKHLKDDLEVDTMAKKKSASLSSSNDKLNKISEEVSPKKKAKPNSANNTPTKNKKKRNSESLVNGSDCIEEKVNADEEQDQTANLTKSPKTKQRRKSCADVSSIQDEQTKTSNNEDIELVCKSPNKKTKHENEANTIDTQNKKKNKKNKAVNQMIKSDNANSKNNNVNLNAETKSQNKKKKNKKNKSKLTQIKEKIKKKDKIIMDKDNAHQESDSEDKAKNVANPNAVTDKDTDSEHESDDEFDSENEQSNEKVLTKEDHKEQSSDEEDEKPEVKEKKSEPKEKEVSEQEIKRTLFVGNVPFSSKCKKEIKKIFNQYGQIETIRIRTIPVKDARVTPKLAVIKNELHPERSTVNVYIRFVDEDSVTQALAANNTVLNGHHLRVTRSSSTGAEHDPRCAVFVGNLPFGIEDETLRAKFQGCGEIASVRVVRDKKTNAGKGFGYVNFATKDGVELALAMTEEDLTIKNRILRVNRCTQSGSKGQKVQNNQKFGQKGRGNHPRNPGKWGQGQGQRNQGMRNQNQGQGKWNQNQGQGKWSQGRSQDGRGQGKFQDRNQKSQEGRIQGGETGAARRLMFKRKQQDTGDGPPIKKQNISKEKKPKKEFVGMTAEKKKKQKFNKDSKKKKALSEILTKKM